MVNTIWKENFLIMCSSLSRNARCSGRFPFALHITGNYTLQTLCGEQHNVCNDEGKINGLDLNRAIREEVVTDMSYGELTALFSEAERSGKHRTGYIVFTEDSFDKPYSEESRTYLVSSDNKAFQPNMGGYSIYGSCLDGSDPLVRLEGYMAAEHGGKDGWKVERCYTIEPDKEITDIIAGTCFICDCRGESFGSLNDEQLRRFSRQFKYPEQFFRVGDEIKAVPYKPEKSQER